MTRRYFVPDVPQTASTDCGLAALRCVLEGHKISVSQRRLQEVLQPFVQVTTLDTLEPAARQLGLDVERRMTPIDHFLLPAAENVPAIVVGRQSDGHTHPRFLVVWRRHGSFFQVMDPAIGLRWLSQQRLLDELDIQSRPVSAQKWRDGAVASGFCDLLRQRLINLKLAEAEVARLMDLTLDDSGWRSLAILDAATRAVDAGVRAGGWQSGEQAGKMIAQFMEQARKEVAGDGSVTHTQIPQPYWSALPQYGPRGGKPRKKILAREVVFLRVRHQPATLAEEKAPAEVKGPALTRSVSKGKRALPRLPKLDLDKDPRFRAERELWHALRADGLLVPTVLAVALAVSGGAVAFEALLLKGIMQLGTSLNLVQRMGALGMLLAFVGVLALQEFPIHATVMRLARQIEVRTRIALLAKIRRLSNRYFVDHPIADLNRRAYVLLDLRNLAEIGANLLRASFQLILTAACVVWLEPSNLPLVFFDILFALGIGAASGAFLGMPIFRCSIFANALNHFYLDALLGLLPARTHSAERSIRREHESALVDLLHADSRLSQRFGIFFLIVSVIPTAFVIWMVSNYVARGGTAINLLLLTYWAFNIPALVEQIGGAATEYLQRCRPAALMLCQVLDAPEETAVETQPDVGAQPREAAISPQPSAVSLRMNGVSVQIGANTILANINLTIKPGEHVAIVGASGAGKTTLVGLLLGWHRPTAGRVLVDGVPLEGERLYALRQETAWVDTGVQLWNRSLLDNLHYGTPGSSVAPLEETIAEADLFNVLADLPNGLQTLLGESGRLVSGGEGQRVRLGRALFRSGVRLAILDEPFRALDRKSRRALLAQARRHWQAATMVLISHDVGDAQNFERVLVMEHGRIVEDGAPRALAKQRHSRYRASLNAEKEAQQALWGSTEWRRLWLDNGQLSENGNRNGQR